MKNADDQITDVSLDSAWKVNKTKLIDFYIRIYSKHFWGNVFSASIRTDSIELKGEFDEIQKEKRIVEFSHV